MQFKTNLARNTFSENFTHLGILSQLKSRINIINKAIFFPNFTLRIDFFSNLYLNRQDNTKFVKINWKGIFGKETDQKWVGYF